MPHEYLIFIHGVSQDDEPDSPGTSSPQEKHRKSYDNLHQGISAVNSSFPNRDLWNNATPCYIEWGSDFPDHPNPDGDRQLTKAQGEFGKRILSKIEGSRDFTLNPVRLLVHSLRTLMIKGFSDIFYYVSREGKNSVRKTVALQILDCIEKPLKSKEPISLTFFGHSAGSVVAFDFLFSLFFSQEHLFLEDEMEGIKDLRALATAGKLRVRRLITFGSPISMLAIRSNAVLKILADPDGRLNPSDYGLDGDLATDSPLTGVRWLNFWDKDDLISWPIEPLMEESNTLKDFHPDVSDKISSVHNQYWTNKKMHEEIAARW